jgi:hypothetical protein
MHLVISQFLATQSPQPQALKASQAPQALRRTAATLQDFLRLDAKTRNKNMKNSSYFNVGPTYMYVLALS